MSFCIWRRRSLRESFRGFLVGRVVVVVVVVIGGWEVVMGLLFGYDGYVVGSRSECTEDDSLLRYNVLFSNSVDLPLAIAGILTEISNSRF
jgi:hypothetical protein